MVIKRYEVDTDNPMGEEDGKEYVGFVYVDVRGVKNYLEDLNAQRRANGVREFIINKNKGETDAED